MKKTIIIGAGASGVYLSILLKQQMPEMEVLVLEQNAQPLKKLAATGNGRCNLSHKNICVDCYQSDNQKRVEDIISDFDMIEEMSKLGLYCRYHGDLLYPKSEQAITVKNILMEEALNAGVVFIYNQEVIRVERDQRYRVITSNQSYQSDYVVCAMGSEAGKLSGINTSRYDIFKQLNLKVFKPRPSLVAMKTLPALKELKGVRVKGTFSLLCHQKLIHQEKGELLFTDYGVSGIAVMQLSSYIEEGNEYELLIDFFDEMNNEKMHEFIELRMQKGYNHFYDGLVNYKLSKYLEKQKNQTPYELLKCFRLKIIGLQDFHMAQVMKGGLSLQEVTDDLEVIKYPHLYVMAENLNVAGMCGGYNLHFAFACAKRVCHSIERDRYVKDK